MKLKFIYTFFTLCLCAFLFLANEDGRAESKNQGNTGAPGDEVSGGNPKTCGSCHSDNAFGVSLDIAVLDDDGNAINTYTAGQTYSVKVNVNSDAGNPAGYGFQIVSLKAPTDVNGDDVAGFSNPAGNVQIAVTTNSGRQYAEQALESPSGEFIVDWTAPEAGTGPVTFYSCGNAVNNNDMSSGDGSACSKLELAEMSTSADDLTQVARLTIAPNPVVDQLRVQIEAQESGFFTATLYDLKGQQVNTEALTIPEGSSTYELPVNHLAKGVYLLHLSNGTRHTTLRVVKQ